MEEEVYGTFRGMKMPHDTPAVAGPFLVRVWKDKSKKPIRVRAQLLPTRQLFRGDLFDTCNDVARMTGYVRALFEEQVGDWSEQKQIA